LPNGLGAAMLDGKRRIERIWKWYSRTKSPRLREELILHYTPMVRSHAEKLRARLPEAVDVEDLVSAGTLGLMEAIEDFDVTQGTRFETYCARKIPGAMLDELRGLDWAPRQVRQRARLVAGIINRIRSKTGRTPTDVEIAECLSGSLKQRTAILRDGRPAVQYSLSATMERRAGWDGEPGPRELEDRRAVDPRRQAICELLKQWLLAGFSRCERLIVLLYYYEQLNMKQIGKVLDLSESRVSQMHKVIVVRLRGRMRREGWWRAWRGRKVGLRSAAKGSA